MVLEGPTSRPLATAALLTTLLAATAWVALGFPSLGIDDADIMFVYARNLASGSGLVYTPGFERVEGFTSLLWVLICAAVAEAGLPQDAIVLGLSLACVSGALAAFLTTARRLIGSRADLSAPGRRTAAWLIVFWILCQPDFFAWNAITLMDLAVWTLLVQIGVLLVVRETMDEPHLRHAPLLALTVTLMVLARPESILFAPCLLALGVLASRGTPRWGVRLRTYALAGAAFTGALGALTAFRLSYFGHPLPNTYYAKVSPRLLTSIQGGIGYLKWFLVERPWMILVAAVAGLTLALLVPRAAGIGGVLDRHERALIVCAGVGGIGLLLPIPGGGDGFGGFRFLQPTVLVLAIPLVLLVAGRLQTWERGVAPFSRRKVLLAASGVAVIAAVWITFLQTHRLQGEFRASRDGRRTGSALSRVLTMGPRPTVGVIAAGGIALGYEGRVVDLMGLNWTTMAHADSHREGQRHGHAAFTPEVFWAEPPDVVVLAFHDSARAPASERLLRSEFAVQVLEGLPLSARFREEYEPGFVSDGATTVGAYFSRSWLEEQQHVGLVRLAWSDEPDRITPSSSRRTAR